MYLSKSYTKLLVSVLIVLSLSGCALLRIPGEIIKGTGQLLGGAMGIAKKVPWWMWI